MVKKMSKNSEKNCCSHEHTSKHIYIYSPAGSLRDKAAFRRGIKRLEAMGHHVEVDPSAQDVHMRFAGNDEVRLAAIHRAAESGADVALITRGAYGLTRLLPEIDYRLIASSIERGTKFIGLSDFTAFQSAVLAKTGHVTWAGPCLITDFGSADEPDEITMACFDDLLHGHGEGAGWRLPKERGTGENVGDANQVYIPSSTLWGGNLAVLNDLIGTPFMPKIKNGILFVEDVGEHPYRIERMLTQLLYAGILEKQRALILGQFTGYKIAAHDKGFKFQTVVDWIRSKIQIPVICNLPFGHVPTKVLLPVGAKVELSVEDRDALIYWGHFH